MYWKTFRSVWKKAWVKIGKQNSSLQRYFKKSVKNCGKKLWKMRILQKKKKMAKILRTKKNLRKCEKPCVIFCVSQSPSPVARPASSQRGGMRSGGGTPSRVTYSQRRRGIDRWTLSTVASSQKRVGEMEEMGESAIGQAKPHKKKIARKK